MFDYETKNDYTIKIKAEDNGVPKLSSQVTVIIKVTNVDEPLTINRPADVKIPENYGTVNQVLKVTATDPDNEAITFKILGKSPFAIGASTGVITVAGIVDREGVVYVHTVTVEASAGGHKVKTTVTITITDINDNIPTFSSPMYIANIIENSKINTEVVTSHGISATDSDATPANNVFSYSISDGNTNDAFKIDSVSAISFFSYFATAVAYKEKAIVCRNSNSIYGKI